MKKFATELGLNADQFNQCLDSSKYDSVVSADAQTARSLGVQSTPSFIVNGQPIVGAQPFEVFQQMIDADLK